MYYGLAEPVIIAGPRNAPRRPLIPLLAILFSSLLAPAPPRPRGTFPPGPSVRPIALPPPLSGTSFLRFSLPLCRRFASASRRRALCNHYRLSRAPLFRFPPFDCLLSPCRLFAFLSRSAVPNSITFHYEWTCERGTARRANFSHRADSPEFIAETRALILDSAQIYQPHSRDIHPRICPPISRKSISRISRVFYARVSIDTPCVSP